MTTCVYVTAIRPLTHEGRDYVKGDVLGVKPLDAAILAVRHLVSLTPVPVHLQTRALTPESPRRRRTRTPADPDRPKRTYRRRDLVAESSTE